MAVIKVDAKGVDCPIPWGKFKKGVDQAGADDLVEIEFTCPDTTISIPGYCENHGLEVVSMERQPDKWVLTAKRK